MRVLFAPATAAACVFLLVSGCALGPDYQRPETATPDSFRTAASDTADRTQPPSLADIHWQDMIGDPILIDYVSEALANSWDIKVAAARVLQAEAGLRATNSRFLPTIFAGGDYISQRTSENGPGGVSVDQDYGDLYVGMSTYEVDLWGRIRRASEASRARLLATEAAQDAVRQALVVDVTSTYLQLLELDQTLAIAQRTRDSRLISLDLTVAREEGGVTSLQDVAQARILVAEVEAAIADTQRRIEQTENAFSILLGRNPGPVARGQPLSAQPLRADLPAGLPSSLLERRPDIQIAEQQLVAANADIGAAKAAFFPQLSLTGVYGSQSTSLDNLLSSGSENWQFGPSLTLPIFTGGLLSANLEFAKARYEESVALYKQSVQGAFRDVSDSLIANQRLREVHARLEDQAEANRLAAELAQVRYEGGVTNYLEVLYSEQQLFAAELSLSQAQSDVLLSVIQLYRALGGGWQMAEAQ